MKRKSIILLCVLFVISITIVLCSCDLFNKNKDNTGTQEATYSVIYELFEGTNNTLNPSVLKETDATVTLEAPTRNGYAFGGWYRDSEFASQKVTQLVSGNTVDVYLYAKWEPITYNVRLIYPDETEDSFTYTITDTKVLPTDKVREHYTFGGWYVSNDFKGSAVTQITKSTGDKTYYAKWDLQQFTVTFHVKSYGDPIKPITYTIETPTFTLPLVTHSGYRFIGWYHNTEYTGASIAEIELGSIGDLNLYARCEPFYKVNLQPYKGTIVGDVEEKYLTASENVLQLTALDALSLPALVREGFVFDGWFLVSRDENGAVKYEESTATLERTIVYEESKRISILSSDNLATAVNKGTDIVNVYAKWVLPSCTITFDSKGGSPVFNQTGYIDSTFEFPKPTLLGYSFEGWYTDEDCTEVFVLATEQNATFPATDVTLYAKWKLLVNYINFDAVGGEPITPLRIYYGQAVADMDLPTPYFRGHNFVGWYRTLSEGIYLEEYVFDLTSTVSADLAKTGLTLYAKWEIATYTIHYSLPEGVVNSPSNPSTYTFEMKNILFEGPLFWDGGVFVSWYDNAQFTGNAVRNVSLTGTNVLGDIYLYAKYNLRYTVTFKTLAVPYNIQKTEEHYFANGSGLDITGNKYVPVAKSNQYEFIGWYEKIDLSGEPITFIKASELRNIDLYPKFDRCYTIKYYFKNTEYTQQGLPTKFVKDAVIKLPAPDKMDNQAFFGWYYDSQCYMPLDYSNNLYVLDTSRTENKIIYGLSYGSTDGLSFVQNDNGTYSVSGYTGPIGAVEIPPYHERIPVASIENEAFKNNTVITSLTIYGTELISIGESCFGGATSLTQAVLPSSLSAIGKAAFKGTALNSIVLADNLLRLEDEVFMNCSQLSAVNFNSTSKLDYIGVSAFEGCIALESVSLPATVSTIANKAFRMCSTLTTVTGLSKLTYLGSYAFARTELNYIHLPSALNQIGRNVFYDSTKSTPYHSNLISEKDEVYINDCLYYVKNTRITSFTFKDGTKGIAGGTFYEFSQITSISLPQTLEFIGDSAFYRTPLMQLTIPASVTRIDTNAFKECFSLGTVTLDSVTPPTLDSPDTFTKNTTAKPNFYVIDDTEYKKRDYWKDYVVANLIHVLTYAIYVNGAMQGTAFEANTENKTEFAVTVILPLNATVIIKDSQNKTYSNYEDGFDGTATIEGEYTFCLQTQNENTILVTQPIV